MSKHHCMKFSLIKNEKPLDALLRLLETEKGKSQSIAANIRVISSLSKTTFSSLERQYYRSKKPKKIHHKNCLLNFREEKSLSLSIYIFSIDGTHFTQRDIINIARKIKKLPKKMEREIMVL